MNKKSLIWAALKAGGKSFVVCSHGCVICNGSEQVQVSAEVTENSPQKTFRWKAVFHLGWGPSGLISLSTVRLSGIERAFPGHWLLWSLHDSVHQDVNKSRSLILDPLQQLWCSGGKSFIPLLKLWPNLDWNTILKNPMKKFMGTSQMPLEMTMIKRLRAKGIYSKHRL